MRKAVLLLTAITFCFVAHSQNPLAIGFNRCGSNEVIKQQMKADPAYARKVDELLKNKGNYLRPGNKPPSQSSLVIPVAVHVIYDAPGENISDAQVQSQIVVLNEDFSAANSDYNNYDAGYSSVKGDLDITFCLVQVIRKQTKHKSFGTNDNMKYDKRGGSDAFDPMHVLNIWVCDLGQSVLGYAYYPGISPEKFGVVCHTNAFGRGSQYSLFADFNLGRTTTHEVGHCLGLAHIWGDRTCGSDEVDDTPLHNTANFGCPEEGHLSTCNGTPLEMWMNYMDYTDDRCMYFFTDGQGARANFFLDTDPQLNSIINSACSNARQGNYITSASNNRSASLNRLADRNVSLFPTITSGQLNLLFRDLTAGRATINVYDQRGALVRTQQIVTMNRSADQIDVSRLGNGLYFLEFITGSSKATRKFIVQH